METKSRSARRAHWQKLVEAQARSGLSLRVFAERLGVSPHTLAYWKYKRPVAGIDAAPKLLPVSNRPANPICFSLAQARSCQPWTVDNRFKAGSRFATVRA